MVVAEFSVIPVMEGSLRPHIKAALQVVEASGLKYEVGAMATTLEGEYDRVMEVVRDARQAVLDSGATRVITTIKLDEREGGLSMDGKLKGLS